MNISDKTVRDIEMYLLSRGHYLEVFSVNVRNFLWDSIHEYFDTLSYSSYVCKRKNLDYFTKRGRRKLWDEAVKRCGLSRTERDRWVKGIKDPKREYIKQLFDREYFYDETDDDANDFEQKFSESSFSPIRSGIARTLTYIRIFPPIEEMYRERKKDQFYYSELNDAKCPDGIEECWKLMRSHPHYKMHLNLNQLAVDSVKIEKPDLFVEDESIALYETIKNSRNKLGHDLFVPLLILKYSTTCKKRTTNTSVHNEFLYLWDESSPKFGRIWGIS